MFSGIIRTIGNFTSRLYLPRIQIIDIVEILIIAVLLYFFMNWIKSTRAYNLLKGMLVVLAFFLLASLFQMTTIRMEFSGEDLIGQTFSMDYELWKENK